MLKNKDFHVEGFVTRFVENIENEAEMYINKKTIVLEGTGYYEKDVRVVINMNQVVAFHSREKELKLVVGPGDSQSGTEDMRIDFRNKEDAFSAMKNMYEVIESS